MAVWLLLIHQQTFILPNLNIYLVRNLEILLARPDWPKPWHLKNPLIRKDGFDEQNSVVSLHESHEGKNHVDQRNLIVDIEKDINALLDVVNDVSKERLREEDQLALTLFEPIVQTNQDAGWEVDTLFALADLDDVVLDSLRKLAQVEVLPWLYVVPSELVVK